MPKKQAIIANKSN